MPAVVVRRAKKNKIVTRLYMKSQHRETLLKGNSMEELPPQHSLYRSSTSLPSSSSSAHSSSAQSFCARTSSISSDANNATSLFKSKRRDSPRPANIWIDTGETWMTEWGAITIQAAWRGYRSRRKYLRMKRRYRRANKVRRRQHHMLRTSQHEAAIRIQCVYRAQSARKQVAHIQKRRRHQVQCIQATRIQAHIRGRQGRKEAARSLRKKRILQKQAEIRLSVRKKAAAVTIQKVFRGYDSRRKAANRNAALSGRFAGEDFTAQRKERLEETNRNNYRMRRHQRDRTQSREQKLEHVKHSSADERRTGLQQSTSCYQSLNTGQRRLNSPGTKRDKHVRVPYSKHTRRRESLQKSKEFVENGSSHGGRRKVSKAHSTRKQKSKMISRRRSSSRNGTSSLHQKSGRAPVANSIESTIACANQSESVLQAQLTGLWTGECLDSNSNVIQITDAVLRFFIDADTGQPSVEGRAKSSSETAGAGIILFQGVYEVNSSRFILVLEGGGKKQTFMGWMKPCRPESAKMAESVLGKDKARGVGFSLEGNSSTGHILLRKRENTLRAEKGPIQKLIQKAKSQCIMKRGNAAGAKRTSKRDKRRRMQQRRRRESSSKPWSLNESPRLEKGLEKDSPRHSRGTCSSSRDCGRSGKIGRDDESVGGATSTSTPLGLLSSLFTSFNKRAKVQFVGAKDHLRELAGPLNRRPEHMDKMSKDLDRMLSRSFAMARELRALETKLGMFGYYGVEEPASMCRSGKIREIKGSMRGVEQEAPSEPYPQQEDGFTTCISEARETRGYTGAEGEDNAVDAGSMGVKHRRPRIASSVFEALRPDFLPSSASGKRSKMGSRASSRGSTSSLLSRGSSRGSVRSMRSRGGTPIASKRLAKFFTAAKAGAMDGESTPSRSHHRSNRARGSLSSLAIDVPQPASGGSRIKLYRRRGRVTLDPMME